MKKLYDNPTLTVEMVSAPDIITTSLTFGAEGEVQNIYGFTEIFGL